MFRIFTFVTDWNKFQEEVSHLREIFRKNSYPDHFFDKCLKIFLEKVFSQKRTTEDPKMEYKICLPFMGSHSNIVRKKLSRIASKYLTNVKISVIWNSPRKLRALFSYKDKLPMRLCSKILYKYSCDGCNSIYLGKSKRHFLVRAYEHLGLSLRTGKKFTYNPTYNNNSGILDHINANNNCNGNINNFKIIGGARNDFYLQIKESILIRKLKPAINSKDNSIPLQLF